MGIAQKRTGRPTREEAPLLTQKVTDTATEMFIAQGYSGTTMEALARAAGISKKTIYSQYRDKGALFRAVIHGMERPAVNARLMKDDALPLEQGLRRRAKVIMDAALEPRALAFYRLIQREVAQFPELGKIIQDENTKQLFEPLASYFARHAESGAIEGADSGWAARLFVYLLFGDLNHRLLTGADPPKKREADAYLDRVCVLFLAGIGRAEL